MKRLLALLCLALPLHAAEPDRRIAITVDDLPWAQMGDGDPGRVPPEHEALMRAIAEAKAPVTGFVNEIKLEVDGTIRPERVQMLRDWLEAGAQLGNHGHAHLDLHAAGLDAYTQDILRGEKTLRPLLAERGQAPRWFRHPFLRAGRTLDDKRALESFLHEHGYRIAPVTVDNSDWIWAGAYRKAPDDAARARLLAEYVPYMLAKLDYYERQSIELLGYNLPHVWLMHANSLNAAAYGDLVAGARERGYRIVTLEEAMDDPAYRRADGYTGAYGPSWLHRWALPEKKVLPGEPETPRWVLDLAGVESE